MKIIFESHATTFDNESGHASGWNNAALSPKGEQKAKELGKRYNLSDFDAVFTSDLQRAYLTAVLAFGEDKRKIFQDWRLRECDYGDFTGRDKAFMDKQRPVRLKNPFPGGESFEQGNRRMTEFLKELKRKTQYKNVLIIGSRVTHYGLETYVAGKSLEQCIQESLSWKWQPGWEYELK